MEKQDTDFDEVKEAVSQYSSMLIKIAFAYLKSMQDAEDAVQDVFLVYLIKRPAFASAEHQRNWLVRCTVNKCKDMLRSAWHKKRETIAEDIFAADTGMQEKGEVMQIIWQLDAKYRIPLHLHYIEGYSIKEIAEMLNKKPATIGTLLARARKKLESSIQKEL